MKNNEKDQIAGELFEYLSDFDDEQKSKILSFAYNKIRKILKEEPKEEENEIEQISANTVC